MSPIRITAAGERIVEPIIALAHCSKLARIIVTGANSAEAVIDLHRLGYARATTTSNCGLPAGQYDVVLLDGRQRSIKAIETTLDWVADFLSRTGVLIVWLDPLLQPATGRPLRTVLESRGFRIEAGTVHERGSAVAARRCEVKPISKVA
jgi:predicted O-methyltransferase YrrM